MICQATPAKGIAPRPPVTMMRSVTPAPVCRSRGSRTLIVPAEAHDRPEVAGKFFRRNGEKLYLRGITYGPFRPGDDGVPYRRDATEDDFARIAAAGFNTARLYTVPPVWLLDTAAAHGLIVMAGVAWEQHVAFLEDGARAKAIVER